MNKKTKNIVLSFVGVIILIVGGCYILFHLFVYNFAKNFVGESKGKDYYEYIHNRLNFHTVNCDNTLQWDTIINRINTFEEQNPQYLVPDSLNISTLSCEGNACAGTQKGYIFNSPFEVYIVDYNSATGNYIDYVYKLEINDLVKVKTDTLTIKEKNRILNRLKDEVLDKIDWNISSLHF
jgi:hypothetical protein